MINLITSLFILMNFKILIYSSETNEKHNLDIKSEVDAFRFENDVPTKYTYISMDTSIQYQLK